MDRRGTPDNCAAFSEREENHLLGLRKAANSDESLVALGRDRDPHLGFEPQP
jgi:hypothetical protein